MSQLLPPPEWVNQPEQLEALAQTLLAEPIIAVDTESNGLHAYHEQVCLLQFSTPTADYLVDPFILSDLESLRMVFASPNVQKVFHASEYDLLSLRRDFGFTFSNLFDTMWAARILGWKAFGLGAILQERFQVHVDKRYQRANWGQRPLGPDLLAYARLDTHYLLRLRALQREELEEKKLLPLAEQDFARMAKIGSERDILPNGNLELERISGARDLNGRELAVLKTLNSYRERLAIQRNAPVFKVFNDSFLIAIARAQPTSRAQLYNVPGIPLSLLKRHGRDLLRVVREGQQSPPIQLPPLPPRPDERYLERLEALKQWRKTTAKKIGVESDVVLPRDLLEEIARVAPRSPQALANILNEVPWRNERYGTHLLRLLEKLP
ncbi:MAG: ribonuclease D [Anaerolineales bacterium]